MALQTTKPTDKLIFHDDGSITDKTLEMMKMTLQYPKANNGVYSFCNHVCSDGSLCRNISYTNNGPCIDHKCVSCNRERNYITDNSNYCSMCICGQNGCFEHTNLHTFCNKHRCKYVKCENKAINGVCRDHQCNYNDCNMMVTNGRSKCETHVDCCDIDGCTIKVNNNEKYCKLHTCFDDACNKVVIDHTSLRLTERIFCSDCKQMYKISKEFL